MSRSTGQGMIDCCRGRPAPASSAAGGTRREQCRLGYGTLVNRRRGMKARLTLLVGCSLTVVSLALLAQEPTVPGAPGGIGAAGGRGRGGGGFVTPTYDKEPPVL